MKTIVLFLLLLAVPAFGQVLNGAVYKVAPDAQGVLLFPVSPQPHIRIRLWTSGPPRAPTNWWVIFGNFPQVALRERIESRHRGTFDTRIQAVLDRIKKALTNFDQHNGLIMDIEVPQTVINQLENR